MAGYGQGRWEFQKNISPVLSNRPILEKNFFAKTSFHFFIMKKYAWILGQSFVSETTNSYLFETFLNVLYQWKDELNNLAGSNGEFESLMWANSNPRTNKQSKQVYLVKMSNITPTFGFQPYIQLLVMVGASYHWMYWTHCKLCWCFHLHQDWKRL